MKVAFYAPLKSPHSAVPSGDRRVARSLIQALKLKGHRVEIASEFQAREPDGLPEAQKNLQKEGREIAEELIDVYRAVPLPQRPKVWFTYHLYYKAMDWIGPIVAEALDIPYIAAEVSYAPKRAGGPWDLSHQALGIVIKNADAIFSLNSLDTACVIPVMAEPKRLVALKPFMAMPPLVDRDKARLSLISAHYLNPDLPIMVTVAMMREGAKLQSYEALGQALNYLPGKDWQLLVIGDGPARAQVESHLGQENIYYLGEKTGDEITMVLGGSDVFVWPAINEAYGMAMLEAQAVGLPVVAGESGGVGDIVRHNQTGVLCESGNARSFADKLQGLLSDSEMLATMSKNALSLIRQEHSLERAAEILDQTLQAVIK